MKRSGFTMIELIFVIVILGILASVAIPKLAATRDDAKISKALNEISMLKNDLSSYYTSAGTFGGTKSNVTNVDLYTNANCQAANKVGNGTALNTNGGTTYYYCVPKNGNNGMEPALAFTLNDTNGQFTVVNTNPAGTIATTIQGTDAYQAVAVSEQFGGQRVNY